MTDTTTIAPADIAADAKHTFSLANRLKGVKLTTRKVVVFTNEDDVREFTEAQRELALVTAALGATEAEEDKAALLERQSALETRREAARAAMLAQALSVHMRAVPDVVMEAGRRAARKAYAVDGVIADELLEDANAKQQQYVLGHVIHRIVDSTGAVAEFDRVYVAEELRAALPLSQWSRIVRAYNEIVFTDQIGDQATLDPGF